MYKQIKNLITLDPHPLTSMLVGLLLFVCFLHYFSYIAAAVAPIHWSLFLPVLFTMFFLCHWLFSTISFIQAPPRWLSGERVRLMTWWFQFNPRLSRLLFPAYFCLSPLQKHVRKVVGGFGKKSGGSTGVRKPRNTRVTDRHDMTLAVKVALNPNTTNQTTNLYSK